LLDANPTCSIAVTQPRRISAISIADRVAEEQCQDGVGGLIGFHVRLESAITADTQLVFMTPGILLRKMQSSTHLNEYTHIVIDEVHERDRYQEFLLIVLRDLLPKRSDLRIILMSATLQTLSLVDYFTSHGTQPAIVEMEGRMFPVQEFFLEEVLEMTGYIDPSTGYDGGERLEQELATLCGQNAGNAVSDVSMQCVMCGKKGFADGAALGMHVALCDGILVNEEEDIGDADQDIESANEGLSQFEDYDVAGKLEFDDFKHYHHNDNTAAVGNHVHEIGSMENAEDENTNKKWDGIGSFEALLPRKEDTDQQSDDELLNQYQAMHDDETVDYILLLECVQYMVRSSYGDGGILVFLPGWQEISEFLSLLESTSQLRDRSKFLILPLHSGIPSKDQRRVLQKPPTGTRKIVLSTNIAETSLVSTYCQRHLCQWWDALSGRTHDILLSLL
jgi:Helicase conserved C-terminal domain